MPVITVIAAPPPGDLHAVLAGVNAAAAGALGLDARDVHSLFVPATAAATGDEAVSPRPTALLHGQARDPAAMAAATEAVNAVLAQEWAFPQQTCWVQWIVTGA